jgi:hypothetical protein
MGLWDKIKRTGQREASAYLLEKVDAEQETSRSLVPHQDYFRIWLCEMFLAKESTLLSSWLPAASVEVTVSRAGRPTAGYSRVLRPEAETQGGTILVDYPVTDLVPYDGGTVEIDAALLGLQSSTRLDLVVDLLHTISLIPMPGVDQALTVAKQVTSAAREMVKSTDGAVHLDLHAAWASADDQGGGAGLQSGYIAALLATAKQVDAGQLRVVGNRLHRTDGSATAHLLGWDYVLLRVEGRDHRDDFWLPELQEQLDKAVDALGDGMPDLADRYRTAAIAVVWKSPQYTWADRDRVVDAVNTRFAAVAGGGRGAAAGPAPQDLNELVQRYGPTREEVLARGPRTPEQAFAGLGN